MVSFLQGKAKVIRLFGTLFLLIMLPLAIFGLNQMQDIRQRASEPVESGYGSGIYGQSIYGSSNTTSVVTPTSSPTIILSVTPLPTTLIGSGGSSNTKLDLKLKLHGLGMGGDSINPRGIGNLNPLRKNRLVTVQLFNSQNVLAGTKQGTITYASDSGDFQVTVDLGRDIPNGSYFAKVQTGFYLPKKIPGIFVVNQGQTTRLSEPVDLKAGDIDSNGSINIADFNILVGCYSDFIKAINCDSLRKVAADVNDDGVVNQFDYNLYIREMSVVEGD